MAVTIPNLDKVQKTDAKLGEAIARVKQYINLNVTPAAGNRTPAPPIDPTQVRG